MFLDQLSLSGGDQAAVVAFNSDAWLLAPLTADRATLDTALAGIQAAHLTRLDRGIAVARAESFWELPVIGRWLRPDKDPDKPDKEFDLVFDVKADGFFNLLRAARGMPLGATVAFSSVAGRFGNAGQTDYSAANNQRRYVYHSNGLLAAIEDEFGVSILTQEAMRVRTLADFARLLEVKGITA